MASKRNADDAGVSQEDLEEALHQVAKKACADRAKLVEKARAHFSHRNGRSATEEELNDVFNTLRDQMVDDVTAQSSSDESEDELEELEKTAQMTSLLQSDVQGAFDHIRSIGREDRHQLLESIKNTWIQETNGSEPTKDETEAVLYNLKHLAVGSVAVEDEDDNDPDYEPSLLEKEAAEDDYDCAAQFEELHFDAQNSIHVEEEQFEALVAKFITQKGRAPTIEEADQLAQCFGSKLIHAIYDEHDDNDYEEEDKEDSSDASEQEHDPSLQKKDEQMDTAQEEECSKGGSLAFQYMKELEEQSDEESDESEPSKQQQEEEHVPGSDMMIVA